MEFLISAPPQLDKYSFSKVLLEFLAKLFAWIYCMHVARIQKPGYSQHVMSLCIIILQVSRLTACVRLWHAPPHVSIFTLNSMGGANKLKSSFVQIYRARLTWYYNIFGICCNNNWHLETKQLDTRKIGNILPKKRCHHCCKGWCYFVAIANTQMLFEIVWNGFEIKRRQEKEIDPHKKAIQFGPCSAWVRFFFHWNSNA